MRKPGEIMRSRFPVGRPAAIRPGRGGVVGAAAVALLVAGCSVSTGSAPGASGATPGTASGPNLAVPGEAASLQGQMVAVIKSVRPSVVLIRTPQGLGSGVAFDTQGDVVTNFHVVQGASSFQVTTSDGKEFAADLVGAFPADDLAVVRARGASLRPATFGDSSKLEVGDIVLAIGNPLGLQSSVTEGIVSATGRTVSEPGGIVIPDAIQTSAAINPGNSGGALVGLDGAVVGIPAVAAVDQELGGAAPGIGFAIPSNTAKDIATQLIRNGRVTESHRAYLGVRVADTTAGGVLVARVEAGGPADRAGIRPGDLITAIGGHPTPTTEALAAVLAGYRPGDQVRVDVLHRDGGRGTVTVTLGQLPGG